MLSKYRETSLEGLKEEKIPVNFFQPERFKKEELDDAQYTTETATDAQITSQHIRTTKLPKQYIMLTNYSDKYVYESSNSNDPIILADEWNVATEDMVGLDESQSCEFCEPPEIIYLDEYSEGKNTLLYAGDEVTCISLDENENNCNTNGSNLNTVEEILNLPEESYGYTTDTDADFGEKLEKENGDIERTIDEQCSCCSVLNTMENFIQYLRECHQDPLWHFILDLLSDPEYENTIRWTSNAWEFAITDTVQFTEQWKQTIGIFDRITFYKIARYIKRFTKCKHKGFFLLVRQSKGRNVYRFFPDATPDDLLFGRKSFLSENFYMKLSLPTKGFWSANRKLKEEKHKKSSRQNDNTSLLCLENPFWD